MAQLHREDEYQRHQLRDQRVSFLIQKMNLVVDYQEMILERLDQIELKIKKGVPIQIDFKSIMDSIWVRMAFLGFLLLMNIKLGDAIKLLKF